MVAGADTFAIAVVDTRPLVAAAMASWLDSDGRFSVRTVASPPLDFDACHVPQVCVVGIAEGSWDWESLMVAIRANWAQTPIVMTLGAAPHRSLDGALEMGVQGLVCEHGAAEDLPKAIVAVARGETYLCPTVIGRMANGQACSKESRCSSLTAREREILRHLAGGQTKREIAADLHLSPKTVDNHTTAIMSKLNIHNRVGLTRFAIREGIFSA
jgi:DNA-binding NarL/FixJ family response regulator